MEMKCEILDDDPRFNGVVKVRVPGIYGTKGNPLPLKMSRLVRSAAMALQNVYRQIVDEGGHLFLSDMFRSAAEQQKAHEDWRRGRKTAYSPPSGFSVHEAARAIDIDAFDTGIGHRKTREILNAHGWSHIVQSLTGPECWHYEFREPKWEDFKHLHGYQEMARGMRAEIGNSLKPKKAESEIRWIQSSLNTLLRINLPVDGIYGMKTREAVADFQSRQGLQVDGIAGPITKARIKVLLAQA